MKVLVIGLGNAGQRHARLLMEMGHTVIGTDTRQDVDLRDVRFLFAASPEAAFKAKPDAVFVCSPPAFHVDHAAAAIMRGIPTFVEKPLAITFTEAQHLVERAEENKTTLAVGFMCRAHATVREAKMRLEQGAFGVVHAAHFECCWQPRPTSYAWPGALIETCHELDLAQWFFGSWRENIVDECRGSDRAVDLLLTFGGVICTFHLDTLTPDYRRSVTLYGDKGSWRYAYGRDPEGWQMAYRNEIHAFLKGTPLCTGREALETVRLCEAMA